MNEEEKKTLTEAYSDMTTAAGFMEHAWNKLAKFGKNVPEMNPAILKEMCDVTNKIEYNNNAVRSVVRVAFMDQLMKLKKEE